MTNYLETRAKILRNKWIKEQEPKIELKPRKKLKLPVLV